jgi:CheY-like chemotaxis protein
MEYQSPILVIEDDEASAFYFEEVLAETGIPVLIAYTAAEAIEMLKTITTCLIFMDIRLPDLDGYQLTAQLRQSGISIPIIAQTAFTRPQDRDRAIESGCDDYLSKPLSKNVLCDTIKKYLHID